jgi:cytochrome P450
VAVPLPPGPGRLGPVDVLRWAKNPFPLLCDYEARYGDAFTLGLPGISFPIVVVSDPEIVKEVFALGPDEGHAGKTNAVLKPLLGTHSLLLLDGAEHLRHRKMLLPAFHGDLFHGYGRTMLGLAHDSIDAWPIGRPFGVHRPMQEIALGVVIRTVLGVEAGPRVPELAAALASTLDSAASPALLFRFMQRDFGPLSPWGRFVRLFSRASDLLRREIRRARELRGAGRTDVLAMMLEARDDAGEPLGDDEVHDELVTLLVAGYETTATSLAWALRWILPDLALVSRLRSDIESTGGDPSEISKLELLDSVVKESLRMQPVVPLVGRVLPKETTFGGMKLPADSIVAPAIHLVHRRQSLYADPDRFLPERFVSFKPRPSEWLPFGGGLRRCIGAGFAMYEMKMVLAATLPRVDAHLTTGRVKVQRRGVTIAPSGGLPIVVTARRPRDGSAAAA